MVRSLMLRDVKHPVVSLGVDACRRALHSAFHASCRVYCPLSLEDINAAIETWSRHTGLEDCSSSIVTATAAFAERRTFRPSTSATNLKSI